MSADAAPAGPEITIDAALDRRTAEALVLEVRQLAQRFGVEIEAVRVEVRTDNDSA